MAAATTVKSAAETSTSVEPATMESSPAGKPVVAAAVEAIMHSAGEAAMITAEAMDSAMVVTAVAKVT